MFPFLTAAALLSAIHQVVVGNVGLIAAVTTAMPDHETLCISLFRGVLRSQPAKALPGNVRRSIVFHIFAAAVCFTSGYQLAGCCFTGITAAAQTCPVRSHFGALSAFAYNLQFAKGLAKQVVCRYLLRPFSPQAATAERTPTFERTLQHIPLCSAVTEAQILFLAFCCGNVLLGYGPAAYSTTIYWFSLHIFVAPPIAPWGL